MTWLTWGAPQGTGGALWQFMLSIQQQPPPVSKHKDGAWNQGQYTDITNKAVDSDTLTGYTPGARHLQREGFNLPQ